MEEYRIEDEKRVEELKIYGMKDLKIYLSFSLEIFLSQNGRLFAFFLYLSISKIK